MLSNEITAIAGAYKKRKRIGRGKGSGKTGFARATFAT